MFENPQRSEISSFGEFGLIDHLTSFFKVNHSDTLKAVGDDAAVIDIGNDKALLISVDQMVEGVHFDLSYFPLKHLGYKAITTAISDIAAMNAIPTGVLVSIAMSNRFSLEAVEEIYKGMQLACEKYKVDLLGGDTSSSQKGLIINVTAIGKQEKKSIVYRKGAKANDLICVTGDLGAAYMGLQLLEREKQVYLANPQMQPDLEGYDYILQRQLKPEIRTSILKKLEAAGVLPTSMIDISDGLASELLHLSRNSQVGMQVYETKLPIDPQTVSMCETFNLELLTVALNGGEDYELLFTVSAADHDKIKEMEEISIIGYCTEAAEGNHVVTKNDNRFELKAQGWQHFKQ